MLGPLKPQGWKDLHSSTFGREPRLPHPSGVFHNPSNRFETMFNVYSIQADLGHGGAGVVYKVMDEDGGLFALKRLNSGLSNSQKLARFKQEVAYCLRARDERIIRILDYGFRMADGVKEPFYVMPLLDGPLRKRMKNGLSHHEAWRLFLNMLDAVECAHSDSVSPSVRSAVPMPGNRRWPNRCNFRCFPTGPS
jgi:serine/threonine protein kinase